MSWLVTTHNNFLVSNNFQFAIVFVCMGAAQLLDCKTARTTNGRFLKLELLLWLEYYSDAWDAGIAEQVYVVYTNPVMNEVDIMLL